MTKTTALATVACFCASIALSGALIVKVTALLGGDEKQLLEQRLSKMESQYAQLHKTIHDLHDSTPHFSLSPVKVAVQEKMFEPLLEGEVTVALSEGASEQPTYVDVVVDIHAKNNAFNVQNRYRLTFGDDVQTLKFTQALPRHGISPDDLVVKVTPFSWYKANPIAPEQVVSSKDSEKVMASLTPQMTLSVR